MRLRPMEIRDLLDEAIALYRHNFVTYVVIVAVVRLPLTLVQGLQYLYMEQAGILQGMTDPFGLEPGGPIIRVDIGTLLALELISLVGGLIIWFGNSVSGGALAYGISQRYLGEDVTIGSAYRFIVRRLWRLLGVSILVGLVIAIVGMAGAMLLAAVGALIAAAIGGWTSMPLGMAIGAVLGAIPAVIPAVWFAFYVPVVVVEDLGGIENMRRSYALVRGAFWRVAGALAMLAIMAFVAPVLLVTLPVAKIGEQWLSGVISQAGVLTVTQVCHQAALVLMLPVWMSGVVMLYYDVRIRREAFDLEVLAREFATA
ncbi:MAG: hypothetical protein ACE5O2_09555 [Armatimonadota bacterium]